MRTLKLRKDGVPVFLLETDREAKAHLEKLSKTPPPSYAAQGEEGKYWNKPPKILGENKIQ